MLRRRQLLNHSSGLERATVGTVMAYELVLVSLLVRGKCLLMSMAITGNSSSMAVCRLRGLLADSARNSKPGLFESYKPVLSAWLVARLHFSQYPVTTDPVPD